MPVFAVGLSASAMTYVKIALTVASAAYSYYANKRMLKDLKKKPTTADDRPSSTTVRGAFLPLLIGRRRVGPVIAWTTDRFYDKYGNLFEAAGHLLAIGPVSRLHRIFENGKAVYGETVEPATTPSGSTLITTNGRFFQIFWGEETPPDSVVPPEVGSLFPRVCYIFWQQRIIGPPNFWPEFTYDIEIAPTSNSDSVQEIIVGSPPVVGTFYPIQDTQNGIAGQNFVEIEGDKSSEFDRFCGIVYEETPERFDTDWFIQANPPTTDVEWTNEWIDENPIGVEFNMIFANNGFARALYTKTNYPAPGKQIRFSFDVASRVMVDGVTAFNILDFTGANIIASIINPGSAFAGTAGDITFSKYPVEIGGVTWEHYDVVHTASDPLLENKNFVLQFSATSTSGKPRLAVINLQVQDYVEYDIRRVTVLDNPQPSSLPEDITSWDVVEDTAGTIEYIDNTDPDYETPPAEATSPDQNRMQVPTVFPAETVYTEEQALAYPADAGDVVEFEALIKFPSGVLDLVATEAPSTVLFSAQIVSDSGVISYETDDPLNTYVFLSATSETDWYKLIVRHAVPTAGGATYDLRLSLTCTEEDAEIWIQDNVFLTSQSEKFKTRIELNEETTNLVDFDGEIAPITPGVVGGANPAGAIHQLLFQKYPYGANLDKDEFDLTSLAAASDIFAEERLSSSIIATDGADLEALLANILQDTGMMMYWDIEQGKYAFRVIREVDSEEIYEVPDVVERPQRMVIHDDSLPNQISFSFADIDRKFKETTILYDNDAEVDEGYGQAKRSREVRIPTAIDYETARTISERRSQEEMGRPASFRFKSAGPKVISPGDSITVSDSTLLLRVLGVVEDTESDEVLVEASQDFYGLPSSEATFDPGSIEDPTLLPQPDLLFDIVELPRRISGQQNSIFIPRIRSDEAITGAVISFSYTGTTYFDDNTRSFAALAGGTLNTELSEDTFFVLENGPVVNILGPDQLEVLDLTGDTVSWKSGRQVAWIRGEWFFVRNVTALNEFQFRLDGLIRARYSTKKVRHLIGESVYIFQFSDILAQDTKPPAGVELYCKPQPLNQYGTVDIADVTAEQITVKGDGTRPAPPHGLTTENLNRAYPTGGDAELVWRYRNGNSEVGAGENAAGAPVGSASPEGTFNLYIYDSTGTDLKRTVTGLTSAEYTYTNAQILADFTSEPSSFLVLVENLSPNGLLSDLTESIIVKA